MTPEARLREAINLDELERELADAERVVRDGMEPDAELRLWGCESVLPIVLHAKALLALARQTQHALDECWGSHQNIRKHRDELAERLMDRTALIRRRDALLREALDTDIAYHSPDLDRRIRAELEAMP